jgi:hypothetical protein
MSVLGGDILKDCREHTPACTNAQDRQRGVKPGKFPDNLISL